MLSTVEALISRRRVHERWQAQNAVSAEEA